MAIQQAIRNGDRHHKASISRQRKAAGPATATQKAEALAKCIRKRMRDGQPLSAAMFQGLSEPTWAELVAILNDEEIEAMNAVELEYGDDEPSADDLNAAFDDSPIPFDLAPTPEAPSEPQPQPEPSAAHVQGWRDREPKYVHSVKWRDAEGCEHLHVIRCDEMDELVREVTMVKALIATARSKANAPKAEAPETDDVSTRKPRHCKEHDAPMAWAISKKNGKPYASHMVGTERCFGR